MRLSKVCCLQNNFKVAVLVFISVFLLNSWNALAQEAEKQTGKDVGKEVEHEIPELSEIIPKAMELSDRLILLEESINNLIETQETKEIYRKIETNLRGITADLNTIKKNKSVGFSELNKVREELNEEGRSFRIYNEPVTSAIVELEIVREDWMREKKSWAVNEEELLSQEIPNQARIAINDLNRTIGKALKIIDTKLNELLKLQQSGYRNQSVINVLDSNISNLMKFNRVNAIEDASAPIFSMKYFNQFDGNLWSKLKNGVLTITFPSREFFSSLWWLLLFQIFIIVGVIYVIKRNRELLLGHEKYYFFADREIAAGLFFGTIFVALIYFYNNAPQVWYVFLSFIGGFAFIRLMKNSNLHHWKKQFLRAIVWVLIIMGVLDLISFPIPLFRLFIIGLTLFAIYKFSRWIKEVKAQKNKNQKYYLWFLYFAQLYLFVILIAEIIGKEILALYMYESLLRTMINIAFAIVFLLMIKAGIEGLFIRVKNRNLNSAGSYIDKSVNRVYGIIVFLVMVFLILPKIFVIWGVFDNQENAVNQLMGIGFNIGDVKISIGIIISAASVLYGAYIISSIIEIVMLDEGLGEKHDLDRGTRLSIAQLIRYFLMFFGFLLAIGALGFDLTNFAIVLSALGVGIGFGLQGVVNNFVSGLILLFERPIREGDTIQVGEQWSEIRKIGLRSTKVITLDQADLIIPNSDLIYNQVTNWTLSNRRARIKITVGVAYGSNIELVNKTLIDIALKNESLFKRQKPQVLFTSFGDNTLDFDLLVWVREANNRLAIKSELMHEIDKRFREENIEIAFPQRDLHLRSIDNSIEILKKK